jgi:hypothetical protein
MTSDFITTNGKVHTMLPVRRRRAGAAQST